jgi:hypothetical protein
MRRVLITALATAAIALSATSAQAATVLNATCNGNCFTGLDIVNLASATGTTVGVGNVDGITVNFTSTTDLLDLANGAATVSTHDGSGFGQLTFALLGGVGFTQADFGLLQGTSPFSVTIHTSDGAISTVNIANPTGNEPFGIQADNGTFITQVDINATVGTYNTFKQLKLGGFSNGAVPEPGTWGLMLLGFGGMGMALRRSRRRGTRTLMQIA